MSTFSLSLAPEQHWRVPSAERTLIRCESGVLWVTVRGEAKDYLLQAGDVLVLERSREALVGAMADSRVQVELLGESRALATVLESASGFFRRFAFWVWMRPAGLTITGRETLEGERISRSML